MAARIAQGIEEMCASSAEERAAVIQAWYAIQEQQGDKDDGHGCV